MSAARSRRTCSRTMLRWGARSSSTQPFAGRRSTCASIGGCRLQSKRSEVRETLRPRGRACLRGCLADVFGKRIIETRLHRNVTVREENASAALEVMSRFAANPRWLVYLPPTMSPPETSRRPGLLEHPDEAFAYFRREGVVRVVCEEKHMGSRAVVVACRDAAVAKTRFGVATGEAGVVVTRTGRRFFTDAKIEMEFLDRLRAALGESGFWDEHKTDWAPPRLRTDALVGEGAGVDPRPVRGR